MFIFVYCRPDYIQGNYRIRLSKVSSNRATINYTLQFAEDGTFQIIVFSDPHFTESILTHSRPLYGL